MQAFLQAHSTHAVVSGNGLAKDGSFVPSVAISVSKSFGTISRTLMATGSLQRMEVISCLHLISPGNMVYCAHVNVIITSRVTLHI